MNRAIYTLGPCGCSRPGLVKLLDAQIFEQAADAQLAKGRRRPVRTGVARYVSSKAPQQTRRLAKVLKRQAATARAIVEKLYRVEKAEDDDQRAMIQRILDQLNDQDFGTDLSDVLDGAMIEAFRRAADVGLTQAGFDAEDRSIVEQVDEKATAYAAARAAELVTDLADTTLDDLRGLITQGVEDGMSTDDLAQRIEDLGSFSDSRAEMIARTELAAAHVQGNVEGWRQSGEVQQKESILGDLHEIDDVCDDCADAGAVDLEDDFTPGYDFPPYHPNCICDVIPVLSEDEIPVASEED